MAVIFHVVSWYRNIVIITTISRSGITIFSTEIDNNNNSKSGRIKWVMMISVLRYFFFLSIFHRTTVSRASVPAKMKPIKTRQKFECAHQSCRETYSDCGIKICLAYVIIICASQYIILYLSCRRAYHKRLYYIITRWILFWTSCE